MRRQFLCQGHGDDMRPEGTEAGAGNFLESDLLEESIQPHPAEAAAQAVGRQGMVGSGGIIARRLRGEITEEDRSGVPDQLREGSRLFAGQIMKESNGTSNI